MIANWFILSIPAHADTLLIMNITLNGEPHSLTTDQTALGLIGELKLGGKRLAMEVNGEIVPKSQYAEHAFKDGDTVEIIHAVGGG